MRDTPEGRNWQTRLTQNQVLRSVGSSPTSGTNAQAAGKFEAFPPLFAYSLYAHQRPIRGPPAAILLPTRVSDSIRASDAATMKTREETQETAAQP